jgi:hypothetical protein
MSRKGETIVEPEAGILNAQSVALAVSVAATNRSVRYSIV